VDINFTLEKEMKKLIFIFSYIFLMNINSCFSQLLENSKKEYESVTRFVCGYSNDFNELDLGITFGKVINSFDTIYYIKFQLCAPIPELREDIQIKKSNAITFLSKSGKKTDLKLTNVISFTDKEEEKKMGDQVSAVKTYYSTILILNVTKDKLVEICSEPFYNIIIPYYNSTSKIENSAIFVKPTLFIRRSFIQKSIKYILDI